MSVQPHSPDTPTDSTVHVNGTRIPVEDVDIHIRNEGPIDVARYCEAFFASPWNGEDYLDVFDSLDGTDGSGMDEVYIEVSPHGRDTYIPAFRGVVTGVGNAGGDTPAQIWKLRAQGPAMFLDKVPVSSNFEQSGAQLIFNAVGDGIDEKLPFDVTVPDVTGFERGSGDDGDTVSAEDGDGDQFSDSGGLVSGVEGATSEDVTGNAVADVTKTFTKNRHTLGDVLDWLSKKTDSLLYFVPRPDGVRLQPYFGNQIRAWDAHYFDGPIQIIENDALSELTPINTLTVNGKAGGTLDAINPFGTNTPTGKFVQVTARHQRLYERAGNTELNPTSYVEDDSLAKKTVERAAKKELRNRITETTGGDMTAMLFAPIAPYDTIRARPTCAGSDATDTEPITYGVSRVHHRIRVSEQSTTKLNVGVAVEDGDIEIVKSGYKEA